MIDLPAHSFSGVRSLPEEPIRVLLVEDEVYYGKLVQRTLRTHEPRFNLTWVTNLSMALGVLTEQDFDIVITDLELPDAANLEAFHAIRKIDAQVPVVILTSNSDAHMGLEAIKSGGQDYIIKERVSADGLVRSIHYAVERVKCENSRLRAEAIRDFMGMLAHDLRVPLLGTARVMEFLDDPKLSQEKKAEIIPYLRTANNQLLSLVSKLIEVYHYEVEPGRPNLQPLRLAALINLSLSNLQPALQSRSLSVQVDLDESMSAVYGDISALERLLINLLDNACKFSSENSVITISAENSEDGMVAVRISNVGPGIPADAKESLFKRFWHGTPGKSYASTGGLGLYLCKKIVDMHHGKIFFESSDNLTTFTIKLPAFAIN